MWWNASRVFVVSYSSIYLQAALAPSTLPFSFGSGSTQNIRRESFALFAHVYQFSCFLIASNRALYIGLYPQVYFESFVVHYGLRPIGSSICPFASSLLSLTLTVLFRLPALQAVRHTFIDGTMDVVCSVFAINLLRLHPLSRAVYNVVIIGLITELHAG